MELAVWTSLLLLAAYASNVVAPKRPDAVYIDASRELDKKRWAHNGTQPATYNSFAGNNWTAAGHLDPEVLALRRALAF